MKLFVSKSHLDRFGLAVGPVALLMLSAMPAAAQSQFDYTNDNGQITITKYTGPGGAVMIPAMIDGLPVTGIGDSASFEHGQLTAVVIPNSVTSIGSEAFSSCGQLAEVTIGNGVTNIGDRAFMGCASLTHIVVPDSVINIEEWAFFSSGLRTASIGNGVIRIGRIAFSFCSELRSITFGSNLSSIGESAFTYCTSLYAVYFKGDAPELGLYVFEMVDQTKVYYLPGTQGWTSTFGGLATVLWNPSIAANHPNFGVKAGQFGFTISGTSDLVVVVEACVDLADPVWTPVGTNTLVGGSSYFSDRHWADYPNRVYRVRSMR
jgi:hypothetical protein